MGLLFYKPKHMKPNPKKQRIKNVPHWILGECIFYINWYKQKFIDLINLLWNFEEIILKSGTTLIDKIDALERKEKHKIKIQFENFKKFCYNIYRKLKKN